VTHGEQQHGGYLVGIGIAAHQRNLALARRNAGARHPHRVDAGGFLAMNVREDPVTP